MTTKITGAASNNNRGQQQQSQLVGGKQSVQQNSRRRTAAGTTGSTSSSRSGNTPDFGDDSDSTFIENTSQNNTKTMSSFLGSKDSKVRYVWNTLFSTRMLVLIVLSLQNSLFTVLRRYSQGVLKEDYSKYEVLLVGEVIKALFSAYMIRLGLIEQHVQQVQKRQHQQDMKSSNSDLLIGSSNESDNNTTDNNNKSLDSMFKERIQFVIFNSQKMFGLAFIYGIMNILSFVSLRNIGAGMFTIFAQCKILTTAAFSTVLLQRHYSYTKWRALASLMAGVLLFSEPIWSKQNNFFSSDNEQASVWIGTMAVLIEVTLSGFASIYFEKVIKLDPLQLNIWERNFQLALGSFPVYVGFIAFERGGDSGIFGGWSIMAMIVSSLGAAGGILVALSIKYGDAILKTLATTAAIVLSSYLDYVFLNGPLTPTMCIAAFQVIISIANYSFDTTPDEPAAKQQQQQQQLETTTNNKSTSDDSGTQSKDSERGRGQIDNNDDESESAPLIEMRRQTGRL